MIHLLLAVIYLSFISLGLPDSLLGSAWPSMYGQFRVPVSYAGVISMIIAVGTILSSLQSDRLTRKLGAGRVTALFADYHLHTWYSDDSDYPMEQLVCDAIARGLSEICITDHVDYGVKDDWADQSEAYDGREKAGRPAMNVKYLAYHAEIQRLRERYAGQITIREGMEFGMQVHTIPQYERLFAAYPFDFIIMSCHQVEDKEFWNQDFQRGRTQEEYNRRYYEEILQVIQKYRNYSVLGHLDMICRYDQAGVYPFEKVKDIVAAILQQVIRDGKGIEVNTSSHRYGLPDLTPSRKILVLYRDLGGTILTVGSDTHEAGHLAAYIRETMAVLREIGFRSVCTFEKMEPVFHSLSDEVR